MERRTPMCPMLMQGYYASPSRNGADWGLDPCACIGSRCAWWNHTQGEKGIPHGQCGHVPTNGVWPDPARQEQK
jgi:hypothetical protein